MAFLKSKYHIRDKLIGKGSLKGSEDRPNRSKLMNLMNIPRQEYHNRLNSYYSTSHCFSEIKCITKAFG